MPRTAQEFETYWKNSPEYAELTKEIDEYFVECERSNTRETYRESHVAKQSNNTRPASPYTVSFFMVRYGVARNFLRMKGDPIPIFSVSVQLCNGSHIVVGVLS